MENSVNRSIIRRLQLVFGISLFILLISSFASFISMQRLIENSRLIAHTDSVIILSENMMSYAKDGETGQRGFLVTRNPVFLQPYNNADDKALSAYSTVKQMTKDNPVQQTNLGQAKVLIDDRFRHLQKVIDLYNSRIYVSDSVNSAEMMIGKQLMDSLRIVVADIQAEEKRLLEIRTSDQIKYVTYTPILLLFAAIISVVITIISYSRVKRDMDERLKEQRAAAEKYIETNKRISVMEQVTRQIAEGNYAIRSEDDKEDELGRISTALNEMVVVLENSFNTLAKKTWLQEGTVKIGDAIRGKRRVDEIADSILETLVAYLNAPVATLYIADDYLNLKLAGSYAATGVAEYIKIGEGLVGQAVKDKKIVTLNNLPDNYLNVSSSIGRTKPANVVILPLIYGSEIIGAIELAFLKTPSQLELELLENNKEAISIGVNAMLNLKRIQGLLEETQAQAEELQAQHSELENLNTELEAQAQKLQASEEELKVQQEELLQTNQELEENSRSLEEKNQLIIERNYEIQKKAEELAISTKYKSEFLANMSHELRTPLNSILLLSRLIAENNEKNLSNEQIEYARVIQSSGNGLLSLIDEILDLSKIEAGKMSLEFNSVTVAEIVNDMKVLFDPIANEKNLELKLSVADDVAPVLETDKMRLEQILKNLLSNALKFTSKGYVSLDVSM
ncbi:MAG: CHASE3 domain-containing protein, partial [Bacteroidetes bacterium]|nr:CHASE3 domain-containing protein [Bacteroidota bacterium]